MLFVQTLINKDGQDNPLVIVEIIDVSETRKTRKDSLAIIAIIAIIGFRFTADEAD